MAYNSAYTGSQVDAAVGAVRQKETIWDGKQDELTGTEDQLVGFNSAGEAVPVAAPNPLPSGGTAGQVLTKTEDGEAWQNAPDGLPEGGTDGQILAKTADGVAWEDKPPAVFLVTAEQTMGNNISLDKDFSEIESAYNAGMIVIVAMENLNSIRLFTISHYIPNRMFSFLNNEAHYLNELGSHEQKAELTSIIISVLYSNICSLSVVSVGPASLSYFDNSETDLTAETVQSAIEEVNNKIPTNYVPTSRTVNGHALSENVTLGAEDVGAVPTTRTINSKPLSSDVTLTAEDVGAGEPSNSTIITLTATGWTGSAAPYSQQVSCSIVAADTAVVVVDVYTPGTDADADSEAINAWALCTQQNPTQGAGTLTFYCTEKPTINIPVKVGVA